MPHTEQPTLTQSAFPVTGQPIRVVMIDGEPWFATRDVCRILGRDNATRAGQLVGPGDSRTLDLRSVCLTSSKAYRETAGGNGSHRGNPMLNLVSEAGLYTLIMRSRKPAAKPFQEWVTAELLPSLRRGDADLGAQRQRMAETLSEALGGTTELVARTEGVDEVDFQVLSDGSVLCRHGHTDVCVPNREEDYGPPFGPYFRCPELRRVGIRGSKGIRPCGTIRFVDVVRRLAAPREPETPAAAAAATAGLVTLDIGQARVQGSILEIAGLLRELGISTA
jgi:prophage antirepressor-like protein